MTAIFLLSLPLEVKVKGDKKKRGDTSKTTAVIVRVTDGGGLGWGSSGGPRVARLEEHWR